MKKLESLPVGPVKAIDLKLEKGVDSKVENHLVTIRSLLTTLDLKIAVKPGTWKELAPELLALSDCQIGEARRKSKPSKMQDIDFREADKMFDEAFGLAAFLEAQRQHLVWRLRWEKKVIPVANWIYRLLNPELDKRLRKIFLNPNITPAVFKSDEIKFRERKKKSAYRAKLAGH